MGLKYNDFYAIVSDNREVYKNGIVPENKFEMLVPIQYASAHEYKYKPVFDNIIIHKSGDEIRYTFNSIHCRIELKEDNLWHFDDIYDELVDSNGELCTSYEPSQAKGRGLRKAKIASDAVTTISVDVSKESKYEEIIKDVMRDRYKSDRYTIKPKWYLDEVKEEKEKKREERKKKFKKLFQKFLEY